MQLAEKTIAEKIVKIVRTSAERELDSYFCLYTQNSYVLDTCKIGCEA